MTPLITPFYNPPTDHSMNGQFNFLIEKKILDKPDKVFFGKFIIQKTLGI